MAIGQWDILRAILINMTIHPKLDMFINVKYSGRGCFQKRSNRREQTLAILDLTKRNNSKRVSSGAKKKGQNTAALSKCPQDI